MRALVRAIVAVQVGLALPAVAQTQADLDRSIIDVLPLFNQNHWRRSAIPRSNCFAETPSSTPAPKN
jgi:hypothetical protein